MSSTPQLLFFSHSVYQCILVYCNDLAQYSNCWFIFIFVGHSLLMYVDSYWIMSLLIICLKGFSTFPLFFNVLGDLHNSWQYFFIGNQIRQPTFGFVLLLAHQTSFYYHHFDIGLHSLDKNNLEQKNKINILNFIRTV